MKDKFQLTDWRDVEHGGAIIDGGNAYEYETGTWRTWRPVFFEKNCTHCLTCWVFCPEDAFKLKSGLTKSGKPRTEIGEINYFHCKGCGLCVKECTVNKKGKTKALEFIKEEK